MPRGDLGIGDVDEASAEFVASALPSARLTILEEQHHGAEMFAPGFVAEALLAFLRGGD